MSYRPLPIAMVLEINLLFTEFQTKTWNCPVQTFWFLLHHLKVPNKGRCTLWDSWHPGTAWRISQTVWSQHLSSQAIILLMCWKQLWNKRCVKFTGCLFTTNRPMLCFLSPPLSSYILRCGRDLTPRLHGNYPCSSAEELYTKNQQQRQMILQQQWKKSPSYRIVSSGQILQCLESRKTNSWKKYPSKPTKIHIHQKLPKFTFPMKDGSTPGTCITLICTSSVDHCPELNV